MAPERPPIVVIFDSRLQETSIPEDRLQGNLYYFEPAPPNQRLRVRWNVASKPEDYLPVAGGVAYIYEKGLEVRPPSKDAKATWLGGSRYRLTEGLEPGVPWLMSIVILPENYTLTEPEPLPAAAKVFANRLALFWMLKGDEIQRTTLNLTIKKLQRNLPAELIDINTRYLSFTPDDPIIVEDICA